MSPSFTAEYMAVRSCAQKIAQEPALANTDDIDILDKTLSGSTHSGQTCAHFLYQEAAMALSRFICQTRPSELRTRARHILDTFTTRATGTSGLAAAQALGSLPLVLNPPPSPRPDFKPIQATDLSTLLNQAGLQNPQCTQAGRSLLFSDQKVPDQVLVLKTAHTDEQVAGLAHEAWWMEYLRANLHLLPDQHIPRPLNGRCRIDLQAMHIPSSAPMSSQETVSLPYITRPEYFTYALSPDAKSNHAYPEFERILARAAYGLGRLSRHGLVHKAPIPLFHNRVQSARRDDHGQYIWTRGGRLDRWLSSCLYPNFGLSGLRDFEHLEPWSGYPRHLFRNLGSQIMSLILATGSWFRLKDPQLIGLTSQGEPVDARHLFDRSLFGNLLKTIVQKFSAGFVGKSLSGTLGSEKIVNPLIEALGMDRHMTEVFRTQDQLKNDPKSFRDLLRAKALDPGQVDRLMPGEQDIVLITGPHLGEFNSRISVPELINFTASVSGSCIAQAYFQDLPAA
ncbi:MAG: SidJ-related pseudokinase [Desulfovermiculus sp.]|nr:SidJ-related pseudokinase [Desulfovermiculus sp.]